MDYGRGDRADALAAEYVIGTLRGGARRRFESLLPAHGALRQATRAWHERLMPLTAAIPPVQPSSEVWRRISDRLDRRKDGAARAPWQRLALWRGLAAFASIAAISLAVLLGNPRAVAPPIVVVLAATDAAASGAATAPIVASISGDRATLVTKPIAPVAARADRSLELWAVPTQGAPRSLGVLPTNGGVVALRGRVLAGADTLAVTVEPPGGSPTGAPTGPIVYAGKFSL
jgi:anti-sigma-K factor RskA